jgi:hypothetical protein
MAGARPARPTEGVQRFKGVADTDEPFLIAMGKVSTNDGASCALLQGSSDEGVPISIRTSDGDETLALDEAAGIDGEARDGRFDRSEACAAGGADDLVQGPNRLSQP